MAKFGGLRGAIATPRMSIRKGGASSVKAPKGYSGGGPERSGASFSSFSRPTSEGLAAKPFSPTGNKLRIDSSGKSTSPRLEKSTFSMPGQQNTFRPSFAFSEFSSKPSGREKSTTPTTALAEGNVRRHPVQAPHSRSLPETPPFTVDPLSQMNGDTTGVKMTSVQAGKLLDRPFDPRAKGVNVIPQNVKDSVRIVELPRRKTEASQVSTEKPLSSGGRAPEIRAELPNASRFRTELNNTSDRRITFVRAALTKEIQSIGASSQEATEKVFDTSTIQSSKQILDLRVSTTIAESTPAKQALFDTRNQTSGARYNTLLRRKVIDVIRSKRGLITDSDITELSSSTNTGFESSPQKSLTIWFYNGNESAPAWDREVRITDTKFIDALDQHLRGIKKDPTLWKTLDRIRAAVKIGHVGLIDLTPFLEKRKKRKATFVIPKSDTQTDVQPLSLQVAQPETVLQPGVAVELNTKVATVPQAAQQEQTGLKIGTEVVTAGAVGERDSLKPKFYQPAQDARKKQWREAVYRFFHMIKPLDTARINDIAGVLEGPTQQTKSPLATVYGVNDGSELHQRELLLHNQAIVTKVEAIREGENVITGIKPVYLNKKDPKEVDVKDVALVLDGKVVGDRKELALAA